MPQRPAQSTVVRRAIGISLATLASRILGFGRDLLMAWLLGGSLAADALVIALRLPQAVRRLFAEGALSLSLTADLSRESQHGYSPTALARAVQWRLGVILLCAVFIGETLATPLSRLLAPGAPAHSPLMAQATELLRICLPYTFTAGMAALGMARLHIQGRFIVPSLMPLALTVSVILFGLVAVWQNALGRMHSYGAAVCLACGVLCGGCLQWLLQELALRRTPDASATKGHVSACACDTAQNESDPTAPPPAPPAALVHRILAHLPTGVLGAAAPQMAMLGAMMAASWLAQGSMAALYYAERLMELPLGLAGAALGMASLPTLSEHANRGEMEAFAHTTRQTLRLSLCVTLPAMTGLAAVATPLVHCLFARGAFDATATHATVLALMGYSCGIPTYGLTRPLLAAAHALGQRRCASTSGLFALALALPVSFACARFLPPHWALLGPAAGVSCGLWGQSLYLHCRLGRILCAHGQHLRLSARALAPLAGGALLTGLAAHAVTLLPIAVWCALPAAIVAGVAVYAAVLALCRCEEWQTLCRARASRH